MSEGSTAVRSILLNTVFFGAKDSDDWTKPGILLLAKNRPLA